MKKRKVIVHLMEGEVIRTQVEQGVELLLVDGNSYSKVIGDLTEGFIDDEVEEIEESIMREKLIDILDAEEFELKELAKMTLDELHKAYFRTFKDYFQL